MVSPGPLIADWGELQQLGGGNGSLREGNEVPPPGPKGDPPYWVEDHGPMALRQHVVGEKPKGVSRWDTNWYLRGDGVRRASRDGRGRAAVRRGTSVANWGGGSVGLGTQGSAGGFKPPPTPLTPPLKTGVA